MIICSYILPLDLRQTWQEIPKWFPKNHRRRKPHSRGWLSCKSQDKNSIYYFIISTMVDPTFVKIFTFISGYDIQRWSYRKKIFGILNHQESFFWYKYRTRPAGYWSMKSILWINQASFGSWIGWWLKTVKNCIYISLLYAKGLVKTI